MIRIAYAEDHVLSLKIITELLQKRGFAVTTYTDGKEIITQIVRMQQLPDVCIINVNHPGASGFAIAKTIKQLFPSVKVLAYSASNYDADIIKILSSGANGYLLKNGDMDELCNAVVAVHEQGVYMSKEVEQVLLKYLQRRE